MVPVPVGSDSKIVTDWPFVHMGPSDRTINLFQIWSNFWTSTKVCHVLELVRSTVSEFGTVQSPVVVVFAAINCYQCNFCPGYQAIELLCQHEEADCALKLHTLLQMAVNLLVDVSQKG